MINRRFLWYLQLVQISEHTLFSSLSKTLGKYKDSNDVKIICLYVKNILHLSKILYNMKTITLFPFLLFSCSFQDNHKVLSESDKIIRVYDVNENLLIENNTGISEKNKSDKIIRVYDVNENLLTENIVGQ